MRPVILSMPVNSATGLATRSARAGAEATISTIDLGTTPPTLHGPFLAGELGTDDGGLFDVAVVPNSPYILVTNFGDELLFRVDVSDPTAPELVASNAVVRREVEHILEGHQILRFR